jgi:hypothetical protein
MTSHRYYGTIVHVTAAGGIVADRLDGGGLVYLPSREAAFGDDTIATGDRLIFSILPGGEGYAAVLD